jgi:hypothetical protein
MWQEVVKALFHRAFRRRCGHLDEAGRSHTFVVGVANVALWECAIRESSVKANLPEQDSGQARDKAAEGEGMGARTAEKLEQVRESLA